MKPRLFWHHGGRVKAADHAAAVAEMPGSAVLQCVHFTIYEHR
jgi:hypothetical protein